MVFFTTPTCLDVTQESPKIVKLVLMPYYGDFHIHKSQCRGCFGSGDGCLRVMKLVLKLHHECLGSHHGCPEVVKLVLKLQHLS